MTFTLCELVIAQPAGRLLALLAVVRIVIGYSLSRTTMIEVPDPVLTFAAAWVPYYGMLSADSPTSVVSEPTWVFALPWVASLVSSLSSPPTHGDRAPAWA